MRRVGSCEYLASDEGSAFDLGLRGLRAAVRALDGRAAATALTALLAEEASADVPALARTLAQTPFPKPAVAALAPVVVRAWLEDDHVAALLVADAIEELILGVRAAREAAALSPGWRLSVTGGVVTGSPEFFREFAAAAARLGAESVRLVTDPAMSVLAALTQFTSPSAVELTDDRVSADVWHLDLAVTKESSEHHRMPFEFGGFDDRLVKAGVSVYLWNLCREFHAAGHQVTGLTAAHGLLPWLRDRYPVTDLDWHASEAIPVRLDPEGWPGFPEQVVIPADVTAHHVSIDGVDVVLLAGGMLDEHTDTFYPPHELEGRDLSFLKPLVFQVMAARFPRRYGPRRDRRAPARTLHTTT